MRAELSWTVAWACGTFVCGLALTGCSKSPSNEYRQDRAEEDLAAAAHAQHVEGAETKDDYRNARAIREPLPQRDAAVSDVPTPAGTDIRTLATPSTITADVSAAPEVSEAPQAVRLSAPVPATSGAPTAAPPPSSDYPAGRLTAGVIDDQQNFREYGRYIAAAREGGLARTLPSFTPGVRRFVHVVDRAGKPVANAKVTLRDSDSQVLLDSVTGSEGATMYLAGVDGSDRQKLSVEVSQGKTSAQHAWEPQQGSLKVTLDNVDSAPPEKLDLALVIDTTGSMGDELEYLKSELRAIAAQVHEKLPNVDQRFGLIVYRDEGDAYVARRYDFTGSLREIEARLAAQSASGGGDYPEAVHVAFEEAQQLTWRMENTARVLVLVADAPPHEEHAERYMKLVGQLRGLGVSVFPVAASGVGDEAEFVFRATALLTLGQYLSLTNDSGLGNAHAVPHAQQYSIEKLGDLMVRVIARKLSGQAIDYDDALAQPPVASHPNEPIRASKSPPSSVSGRKPHAWLALAALLVALRVVDIASS